MFEEMSYDEIMKRMISNVPSDLDRREGSVIYTAIAPCAIQLAQMYVNADIMLNEMFADTASRYYLIKRASERGLNPYLATYALLKGRFNIEIPLESRFSGDTLNYMALELIEESEGFYYYQMMCETVGAIGNDYIGTLIPIEYIDGLKVAEITQVIIHGEDEEDTEALRKRYFNSFSTTAYGGNISDYKQKVMSLADIGGVKVYPVWNGGGSVKLVIQDSAYGVPSSAVIKNTQNEIDPTPQGTGVGIAPIGHTVTVVGVGVVTINVTLVLTYSTGKTWTDVQVDVTAAIQDYFDELNESWDSSDNLIVRVSQIESRVLNVINIIDVGETVLKVGNSIYRGNYECNKDSICILGTVGV